MKNINRGTSGSNPLYETSKWQNLHQDQNTKTRIQRMYQYPASVKQAEMHRKANEFGYNSKTTQDGRPAPLCPCCELPINTVRIKMKYGTTPSPEHIKPGSDIFLLNAGSAMFFTFIKMTVTYLVLRFLLSDCYNLITNMLSTNCDIGDNVLLCKNNIFSKFSSYNKRTQNDEPYLYVLDILNLVTIVCSTIFFFYYRKEQYEIYTIADLSNTSQADFSIFVEEIPFFLPYDLETGANSCLYEEQLKKVFEKEAKEWVKNVKLTEGVSNKLDASFYKLMKQKPSIEKGPIVRSVSLCFDLTEMQKLNEMRTNLMARHNENVANGVVIDDNSISYIPNQINCINNEYIELSKKFSLDSSMAFSLSHFVGKAFVSFQYAHYQQYFLEYYKGTDKLKLADRTLKLGTASQPSDIYWFNMKVSKKQRIISVFYSGLIMLMALCFSFVMLLGLQYYQLTNTSPSNPLQSTQSIFLSYLFTLSMTVLTTIINYILAFTCQKLTEWERHNSKTDYIISLMTKSVISQFINTAFIYYMIGVVADLAHSDNASPLSENGIVTKVSSLVAVSGGIQIFLNAVQLGSTFSCLMNKIKIRGDTVNMFQVQLNQKMQDAEFAFSDRYTYYIVNVYIVSFFSYITPYTTIILVPIFIVQYWIDKYNLFQRFSCPTDFDFRLSRMTLKIFEISVLVFALGNYIFSLKIHATKVETKYHIINLVGLLLAVAYSLAIFFLPKKWFQKIQGQAYETISYTECLAQEKFNKVYWLTNPGTSFAKEPDLNAPNKFVNYGHADQYAKEKDYEEVLQAEVRGTYKIETYDKDEVQNAADILASIQQNIGGLIAQNSPQGQFYLFGKDEQPASK